MGLAELTKNAVHVLPEGGLEAKLALERPLRVKLGIDPTAPDIHLGSRTCSTGSPPSRRRATPVCSSSATTRRASEIPRAAPIERPVLPGEVLRREREQFAEQAFGDPRPRAHGDPLQRRVARQAVYAEVVRLTSTVTVARLLERDDFAKRFAEPAPISVSELLYPIMQGYDSVAVEADIELGGTDQLYNLLMGREVQQAYGQEPQVVLTGALLVSLGRGAHEPVEGQLHRSRRGASKSSSER